MSKSAKIWLITAASLILIGCMIFGGVITMLKWDFSKLSTNKYQTSNFEISEDFKSIRINADTADISIAPSKDGKCSVVYFGQTDLPLSVSVKDNTLAIEVIDGRKWYEHIGINFKAQKITVYIPEGEYAQLNVSSHTGAVEIPKDFRFEDIDICENTGSVTNYASASNKIKIKTTTGSIRVENISARSLELEVSTGSITASSVIVEGDVGISVSTGMASISDLSCLSFKSTGDTGDILLKNVIANEKLSVNRTTGDIRFYGCDAAEIFVQTDTGNVLGTLLSDKIFIANTDTGRKQVPNTVSGGRCEITTDTGDIKISIQQQ